MERTLFIVLAVCTLSTATAVWRHGRVMEDEDAGPVICAPQTPCGWAVYNQYTMQITSEITNTYCICGPGTRCEQSTNDREGSIFIKKCLKTDQSL